MSCENYKDLIFAAADRYSIDRGIGLSQAQQESGCKPNAISPAGAQGLWQFMPDTARRFGLSNPFDPVAASDAWGRYMRFLLDRFNGRYDIAIAGYNWGEGSRERGNRPALYQALDSGQDVRSFNLPAETRNYLNAILPALGTGGAAASPSPGF